MNTPTPALVTKDAAQRLPRLLLWVLWLAYLIPGLIGRDPWKNADMIAFGYMANIARGVTPWAEPAIGAVSGLNNVLPYWIGAFSIQVLGPWIGDPMAARVPFMLLLGLSLILSWYACYYLARTEAAQPVAFAFGGEAHPVDYARAIADGSLLALMASLGLLQLGHETTPDLLQLASVSVFLYGLAASAFYRWRARLTVLLALPVIALSGSPSVAILLGLAGLTVSLRSHYALVNALKWWLMGGLIIVVAAATWLDLWAWRWGDDHSLSQMLRLFVWFTWPCWPLVLWTLWRWRRHLQRRHIAVPLSVVLVAIAASIWAGGSDRALLLALPGMSILAAFALPTLKRSVSGAIDWFSLFFFSFWAILFWVVYISIQTGIPAQPALNVARLLPGYVHGPMSWWAVSAAVLASLAWVVLVVWRAGRFRHPLWTSLILPASGVALGWLLVMSLHLPLLNFARSYAPYMQEIQQVIPSKSCVSVQGPLHLQAALESQAGYRVVTHEKTTGCEWHILSMDASKEPPVLEGWHLVQKVKRPGDKVESVAIYRH